MGNIGKKFSLLLVVILAVSSLIMVESALAQSITKPSVPEFTLKYVDNSYDVPPTTTSTTDPYTGKTITTTTPGYRVEKKSIEITVTNQPFTSYSDAEGHLISLFYNVRFKGHFGGESTWTTPFYKTIRNGEYGFTARNPQSNSGYTIISVPSEFRVGDVVDFQVQTLEGFHTPWEPLPMPMGTSQFTGQSSDWSNTQTITIGQTSTSNPTPNPTQTPTNAISTTPTPALNSTTPTPTVPEFSSLTIPLLLFVMLTLAGLVVYHKKILK